MPSLPGFHRIGPDLHCDGILLEEIAERHGTPTYVYSEPLLRANYSRFHRAFEDLEPLICYSVKACSNLAVLARLAAWGAGFDIVSGGELHRVLCAGGDPARIVFAGVGKQVWEIELALEKGVGRFNAESLAELERISTCAERRGVRADVALRVNPDVDARTHRYITTGKRENKFGTSVSDTARVVERAEQLGGIRLCGLHCHIGSQICDPEPFVSALQRLVELLPALGSERFDHLDLGGGFGIETSGARGLDLERLSALLVPMLQPLGMQVIFEPGRFLVGPAGVLLTRVIEVKPRSSGIFAIVDAGMNDLLRPSLYQAVHRIEPARSRGRALVPVEVVGPICETADFLAREQALEPPEPGDLLVVRDAGAYGFSMSSQYNSRPRAAELLVDRSGARLARRRETLEDLVRGEALLDHEQAGNR